MIKALYIIAIGLLFAAFIGFGVNTFYPQPEYPGCRDAVSKIVTPESSAEPSAEQKLEDQKCRNQQEGYQDQLKNYQQNLSVIYLIGSILIIALSLFGLGKIHVIGDGLTLGGIFVLFTGIVVSFNTASEIFRFLAVTTGLVIILFLSYWKFVRGEHS